jgi:hypothetical protein
VCPDLRTTRLISVHQYRSRRTPVSPRIQVISRAPGLAAGVLADFVVYGRVRKLSERRCAMWHRASRGGQK